ncbi:MAG TPA: sigma-70 family RNA polymerase sigma factor [Xanthobacteraceae bacterium]|nr:sigma-70 family RNA polymerase sigma factor [Xanthobacteraceae bacterium]
MSSHKASPRRSWQAETPGTTAVTLLQGAGERVVGRADRPTASDAGSTQSREALLQACAGGDQTALHSLYKGIAPQLFGLALRMLRRRDLAEEIVQESFVSIWRSAHNFDPARGTAMAWLARIVRNRCIDLLRQRGRETPLDEASIEDCEDPLASPADMAVLSQDARRLQHCLGELEENPRKVLGLVYYEGMTYQEAAVHVGAPLGTVKSWIRRSLIRLRDCMER